MRSHASDRICSSISSLSPSLCEGVGVKRFNGNTELEMSNRIEPNSILAPAPDAEGAAAPADDAGVGAEDGAGVGEVME